MFIQQEESGVNRILRTNQFSNWPTSEKMSQLRKCHSLPNIMTWTQRCRLFSIVLMFCSKALHCTPLDPPEHGASEVDSFQTGGVAEFTCASGYEVEGPEESECQNDGTWSHPVPECRRKYLWSNTKGIVTLTQPIFILTCIGTMLSGGLVQGESICTSIMWLALNAKLGSRFGQWARYVCEQDLCVYAVLMPIVVLIVVVF